MEESEPIVRKQELQADYEERLGSYAEAEGELVARIRKCLSDHGLHLTVKSRVKSFQSYFKKKIRLLQQAKTLGRKYPIPINDQIAIRIVCHFVGDMQKVVGYLRECFRIVETEKKGADRSFKEFGYESTHLLLEMPKDLLTQRPLLDLRSFEVQVRTILQDAWAEVEHELVYKADFTPFDEPMRRKLAALNANLTLSDIIFQEIRDYQHRFTEELGKRRGSFFRKIESEIDEPFFASGMPGKKRSIDNESEASPVAEETIDNLLLTALNEHNNNNYTKAIETYGRILSLEPKKEIKAIIVKHRGMAFFSESRYDDALKDFSVTLELDPSCHKAAYFRGVVHSVMGRYPEALEDFNAALTINPYHFYSLFRRAQVFFHLGDMPKALADCETALGIDPSHEQAIKLKAIALDKLRM